MKFKNVLSKSFLWTLLATVTSGVLAQDAGLAEKPEPYRQGEFWRMRVFETLQDHGDYETTRQVEEVFSDGYAWTLNHRPETDVYFWVLFNSATGSFELVRKFDRSIPAPYRGAKSAAAPQPGMPFPLKIGKTFSEKSVWPNRQGTSTLTHTVEGIETVTVPAGTFKTWKITTTGTWYKHSDPDFQGTEQATSWYSPEAKVAVKKEYTRYVKGRATWKGGSTLLEWKPSQNTNTSPAPTSPDLDAR